MYIHKTRLIGGARVSHKVKIGAVHAKNHHRSIGSGIKNVPDVFDNGVVKKATEVLRNVKLTKSRIPKSYISFKN
jgi:hypothetical protein